MLDGANIRPRAARRTPSRDEPIIRTFEVSPSRVYKDMVGKGFFQNYFSPRIIVYNGNYRGVDYTIARSINAIHCRFSGPPLLNHD